MTSEKRDYEPSSWERSLAAMAVGLMALGVLGIALTLVAAAFQWSGSFWPIVTMTVLISLPLAILLLIALVVTGIVRRRRN